MEEPNPEAESSGPNVFVDFLAAHHVPNLMFSICIMGTGNLIAIFGSQMGASKASISFAIGMVNLGKVVLDIPAGLTSHRYGCRNQLLVSLISLGISLLLMTALTSVTGLMFSSLIHGCCIAFFMVARHQLLSLSVEKSHRGRLMSLIGGGARWGSMLGALLTGVIADWNVIYAFFTLIPLLLCGFASAFVSSKLAEVDQRLEEKASSAADEHSFRQFFDTLSRHWNTVARVGLFAATILGLRQCRRLLLALAALHFGLSPTLLGVLIAVSYVVDATLFFLGGYVMDRFGRRFTIIPTPLLMGATFVALSLVRSTAGLFCVAILFGLSDSIGSGMLLTMLAEHSPPDGGSAFLGVMRSIQDVGALLGPLVVGVAVSVSSFEVACVVVGLWGFAAAAWAWLLIPETGDPKQQAQNDEQVADAPEEMTNKE